MALDQIACDIFCDDGGVVMKGFDIGFAHLRGNFEPDVKQLAEVRVVAWI